MILFFWPILASSPNQISMLLGLTTLANRLRILSMRVPDLDANLLEDAASELPSQCSDIKRQCARSNGSPRNKV